MPPPGWRPFPPSLSGGLTCERSSRREDHAVNGAGCRGAPCRLGSRGMGGAGRDGGGKLLSCARKGDNSACVRSGFAKNKLIPSPPSAWIWPQELRLLAPIAVIYSAGIGNRWAVDRSAN